MIKLTRTLAAWNTPEFISIAKSEIEKLDADLLPLQQNLAQTNYVSDEPFQISISKFTENHNTIQITADVFYTGIIMGCNCADDPTPANTIPEHCKILIKISKTDGSSKIILAPE